MKDIWTEGSGARQRSWYDQPTYNNTTYYPTKHERKRQQATTIEYIEPPERYAAKHPIKTAINRGVYIAAEKAVNTCHAIPTKLLGEINQGLILATNWINTAIGAIVTLFGLIEWGYLLFAPMDITTRSHLLWMCGCSTAVVCTICILIYRYHHILNRRFDIASSLEARHHIIRSLKKTAFMMGRTLLLLYVFIVPHVAKIATQILIR